MAFVARNDQHGNEVMRVMLSTEPGSPTIASCQNLRINFKGKKEKNKGEGRYDHRQRFHYFAADSKMIRRREHNSQSLAEPIAEQERQKEREITQKLLREKQSHSEDESGGWNNTEINAHSTLVSDRKTSDTTSSKRDKSTSFYSWLAIKNKNKQQQAEDRRLIAQQENKLALDRARLAHQKYLNWLTAKSTQMRRAKSDLSLVQDSATSRQSLPAHESLRRLQDWEREKLAAMKAQRQKRKAKEEEQQLIDSTRRELSAEAWEQWVDASKSKPRPVPMGKGLDSLKGCMGPIYTNPNEWQPVSSTSKQNPKVPIVQSSVLRNGPNFKRIDRLAQPKRKLSKTKLRLDNKCDEGTVLKMKDEDMKTLFVKSGNLSVGKKPENQKESVIPLTDRFDSESWMSISGTTEVIDGLDETLEMEEHVESGLRLHPRVKPIVWSKKNAQRVRELREVVHPLDALMPRELRDDQVEQLRKHQDLQNSKVLPKKYQQKREYLRVKLKTWIEEGKLLPDHRRGDTDLNLKRNLNKINQAKQVSQSVIKNNVNPQRAEEQKPSTARNAINPDLRARIPDPARLLKFKEAKAVAKNRPWR